MCVQVHDGPSDCLDLVDVLHKLVGVVASSPAAVELAKKFAPRVQVCFDKGCEAHSASSLLSGVRTDQQGSG